MSTTYPAVKQTFSDPSGASLLTSPDHASLHTTVNDTLEALQDTIGTTPASSLFTAFVASDKPAKKNNETFGTVNLVGGTINAVRFTGGTIDASSITGGTITGQVVNTGTISGGVFGTAQVTGGTVSNVLLASPTVQAWDGWMKPTDTWIYLSGTTMGMPGGTAIYQGGDMLKFTQGGTQKYFYLQGIGGTLGTLAPTSSFTLENAAIANNFYSNVENPQGFPDWLGWSPTFQGYSGDPVVGTSIYKISRRTCFILYAQAQLGTSNAATTRITGLPVASAVDFSGAPAFLGAGYNAGTNLAAPVYMDLTGNTLILRKDFDASGWGTTGTKGIYGFYLGYKF